MSNRHRLAVGLSACGKDAYFLNTERSLPFRVEYPVQLKPIVYWSKEERQTVEIFEFLFQVYARLYITPGYLEDFRFPQPSRDVSEGGIVRTTLPRILSS